MHLGHICLPNVFILSIMLFTSLYYTGRKLEGFTMFLSLLLIGAISPRYWVLGRFQRGVFVSVPKLKYMIYV